MSTAQRLNTFLKMTLAGTTSVVALAAATPAQAQLNYGEIVTTNTYMNSSYDGYIYRVNPATGQRTAIGSSWSWTERPAAVTILDRNTLLVSTIQSVSSSSSDTHVPKLYKVDVNTGARTRVSPQNSWLSYGTWYRNQIQDMEYDRVNDKLYFGTGYTFWSQQESGRYWRVDGVSAKLDANSVTSPVMIYDTGDASRAPIKLRLSDDGTQLKSVETFLGDSYQSYFNTISNIQTGGTNSANRNTHSSYSWNDRLYSFEPLGNGDFVAGYGTHYSSYDHYLRRVNSSGSNQQTYFNNPWQSSSYSETIDIRRLSDSDDKYIIATGNHYNTSNGPAELWIWDQSDNTRTEIFRNGQNGTNMWDWDQTVWDMAVYQFGLTDTGFNDLVINGATANVVGSPNFRADDSDATLAVSDLLTALASNNVSARNGYQGDNNQQGNVTLASALDYDGIDSRTLTLRASNDLTIATGATITDGDTGTSAETLNAVLVANNQNQGTTGKLTLGAAVDLNGGTLTAEGKSVEFDAAVSAGATTVKASSSFIVDAALTTTGLTVTGGGDATFNAAVDTGAGNTNLTVGDVEINSTFDTENFTSTGTGGFTTSAVVTAAGDMTLDHDGDMVIGANLSAGSLTTAGAGGFDASAATLNVSGALVFGHSGTTRLAALSADSLTVTSSQLITGAQASFNTLDIGSNTVTVGAEANVEVGAVTQSGGSILIAGGRYQGPVASYVELLSGTLAIDGTLNVAPGQPITNVLGSTPSIGVGQEVEVSGNTALSTTLVIDGGQLTTGSISSAHLLDFQAGTLELTNSSLTVSSTGALGQRIELGEGRKIALTGENRSLTIAGGATGGIISIDGGELELSVADPQNQIAPTLVNNGNIELLSELSTISGNGSITNNKNIQGTGRVMSASVNNTTTGQVRVEGGDELLFAGDFTNQGSVNFLGDTNGTTVIPASVEFEQTVVNTATGRIEGQAGIIRFANKTVDAQIGDAGLVNSGEVRITGATTTDVFGSVFQSGGTAKVIVSGGALANFYGDVYSYDVDGDGQTTADAAEVRVAAGSGVVFLGEYHGLGRLTGAGTKFFKGGFDPGQSPGEVTIEGNVELGESNVLTLELGGYAPGDDFDVVNVLGQIALGGTLNLTTIDGFVPRVGDSFEVMTFGSMTGGFDGFISDSGLGYSTAITGNALTVTITSTIPEPGTALVALGGLAGLCVRRRRAC